MFCVLLFITDRRLSDNNFLRDNLLVDLSIAIDAAQQQLASLLTHEMCLVLYGRQAGRDIAGMHIISKPDDLHIVRNMQSHLLDGIEGSKGHRIVEGKDGIGPLLCL